MKRDKTEYNEMVDNYFKSMGNFDNYLKFLKIAGTSHFNADNLACVLSEKANATHVGTLTYWNMRYGLIIQRNERGIRIPRPVENNFTDLVVFDTSQTRSDEKIAKKEKPTYYDFENAETNFFKNFKMATPDKRIVPMNNLNTQAFFDKNLVYINDKQPTKERADTTLLSYSISHFNANLKNDNGEMIKAITMYSTLAQRLGLDFDYNKLSKEIKAIENDIPLIANKDKLLRTYINESIEKSHHILHSMFKEYKKDLEKNILSKTL